MHCFLVMLMKKLKNQNLSNQEGSEIVVENIEYKSTKTTVPFLKDNEFDYSFFSTINGEQNRSINFIVELRVQQLHQKK